MKLATSYSSYFQYGRYRQLFFVLKFECFTIKVLNKKHYGKSVLNQPSEMKYQKYSQMTKFLFYRYSPETPREGEPSELFCRAGDTV